MKNFRTYLPAVSLCALLILTGSVFAKHFYSPMTSPAGRPEVKVSLVGTITRDNQNINVEKAGTLNPGEILSWTITSHNTGTAPAQHYKTVGEIPAGTAYVSGTASAIGDAQITYSIDGGKTFELKPMIEQKQPDGSLKKVAAPASMYTQVRYEWNTPLSEGKQFLASYKVRVK